MLFRTGRVAIAAIVARGASAWPKVDRILDTRPSQAVDQVWYPASAAPLSVHSEITSATSSASTAYPTLPSFTPSDGGKLSCPANDGQIFTDSTGKPYNVSCYKDYLNYVQNPKIVPSLDACAASCSNNAGCIAAVWRPESQDGPCYFLTEVGFVSTNLGSMALVPSDGTSTPPLDARSSAEMSIITTSSTTSITSSPTTTVETTHVVSYSAIVKGSSIDIVAVTSTMTLDSASSSAGVADPAVSVAAARTEQNPYVPCGVLNQKSNTFYLRSHVIYGNIDLENLYVQDNVYGAPPHIPTLTANRTTAAHIYYDFATSSIAFWHGHCTFSGIKIDLDHDYTSWSPVMVGEEVGTPKMSIAHGELWWDNDRFGSWLVCEGPDNGVYEWLWWDTITDRGIDAKRCAKVQLLTENL